MNSISTSLPTSASFTPSMGGDDLTYLRGKDPKQLAQQFEGIFVSMLVKEMRQSSIGGEGMFPGDGSDTFGGIFDQFMGQHIAESGGIGMSESIAAAIRKQAETNIH